MQIKRQHFFLIALILKVLWGLVPSASKFVINEIPSELYITLRWGISGSLFFICVLITDHWRNVRLADLLIVSVLGILCYGGASLCMLYGLSIGGVINFSLIASLGPVLTALLSIFILNEKPKREFLIALPISVSGLILVLIGKFQASSAKIAATSSAAILLGFALDSFVFVISKRYKSKMGTLQFLAISQLAATGAMLILQATIYHQTIDATNLTPVGIGSLIYVSLVACFIGYGTFYWLLQHFDGHKLALFDGVQTVSSVFFGYLFFSEPLNFSIVAGGLMVIAGLYCGNRGAWSSTDNSEAQLKSTPELRTRSRHEA